MYEKGKGLPKLMDSELKGDSNGDRVVDEEISRWCRSVDVFKTRDKVLCFQARE